MTVEEALIFLPGDDENDTHDLYDEKLFDLKQFFLSRFPMTKLINARLSKFEKIEEAYLVLGGEVSGIRKTDVKTYPVFDSIHDVYIWYNIEKNSIRLQLSSARSHQEVSIVLAEYLQMTRHYAKYWYISEKFEVDESVKMGVEPNPMDIQSALSDLSMQEKLDIAFILELPDDNCLKSEAKRLSLWLNFEIDE